MKKYYILRSDGSALFQQAYPEDFCFHCLVNLIDRTPNERYRLCEIDLAAGTGRSACVCLPVRGRLVSGEQKKFTYVYT